MTLGKLLNISVPYLFTFNTEIPVEPVPGRSDLQTLLMSERTGFWKVEPRKHQLLLCH